MLSSLWLALQLLVRFGLRHLPKALALIEPIRTLVLQRYRHRDAFAALVGLIDDVTHDSAADPAILMRGLDLQLAYFDKADLIEHLDHTHTLSLNLDD
jgi:hypothetical protein